MVRRGQRTSQRMRSSIKTERVLVVVHPCQPGPGIDIARVGLYSPLQAVTRFRMLPRTEDAVIGLRLKYAFVGCQTRRRLLANTTSSFMPLRVLLIPYASGGVSTAPLGKSRLTRRQVLS